MQIVVYRGMGLSNVPNLPLELVCVFSLSLRFRKGLDIRNLWLFLDKC